MADVPVVVQELTGSHYTTIQMLESAIGAEHVKIVNGGLRIKPSLIDRVQDRNGKVIWRAEVSKAASASSATCTTSSGRRAISLRTTWRDSSSTTPATRPASCCSMAETSPMRLHRSVTWPWSFKAMRCTRT